MLRVMTIVGTRPEIIRLSRIIEKFDKHFIHTLVHTGQNYDHELNQIFFDDLGIRSPDVFLDCAESSAGATIGAVIEKTDALFKREMPDALLILGDTNSALAAISAKRNKIPIFHMEAGNRCFDLRVPEEINRKIVDHISDVNLPYSTIAREYLLREGLPPDFIVKTGSPMREILNYQSDKIGKSKKVSELGLASKQYFLVSLHREENVDSVDQLRNLSETLDRIACKYKKPIIFSVHPRTKKRLMEHGVAFHDLVQIMKPLSFSDYVSLQTHATVVLSDSGTITEEASILGLTALNLREAQERPEGLEEGVVMFTGLNPDRVLHALEVCIEQRCGDAFMPSMVRDYNVVNVSDKVVGIIISYVDYVNRKVWSMGRG
jgi:UDP-N-acetylglucosamine 2-epimerase (non-hydrolysing)